MGSMDVDDFISEVWPIFIVSLGVILSCLCLCFCCPCCPWYKSRRRGTVYQNITHPPGTSVQITTTHNTTGYPISTQIHPPAQHQAVYPVTMATQPGAFPVQQPVYAPHTAADVPYNMSAHMAPAPGFGPAVQPQVTPYGQPPPYSEVARDMTVSSGAPPAAGVHGAEGYEKQPAFNPYYSHQ